GRIVRVVGFSKGGRRGHRRFCFFPPFSLLATFVAKREGCLRNATMGSMGRVPHSFEMHRFLFEKERQELGEGANRTSFPGVFGGPMALSVSVRRRRERPNSPKSPPTLSLCSYLLR